jgi:hypothetical protein
MTACTPHFNLKVFHLLRNIIVYNYEIRNKNEWSLLVTLYQQTFEYLLKNNLTMIFSEHEYCENINAIRILFKYYSENDLPGHMKSFYLSFMRHNFLPNKNVNYNMDQFDDETGIGREKPLKTEDTTLPPMKNKRTRIRKLSENYYLLTRIYDTLISTLSKYSKYTNLLISTMSILENMNILTTYHYNLLSHAIFGASNGRKINLVENIFYRTMSYQKCIPNTQSYNILLDSYSKLNLQQKFMKLFNQMSIDTYAPRNIQTYGILFQNILKIESLNDGKVTKLLFEMKNEGFKPDSYIFNIFLVASIQETGNLSFLQMISYYGKPDIVTYNVLLKYYYSRRDFKIMERILQNNILGKRLKPDDVTLSLLLRASNYRGSHFLEFENILQKMEAINLIDHEQAIEWTLKEHLH